MEDAKSVQASGPPETTGPSHSLDSGTIPNLVVNEDGKEGIPWNSSGPQPSGDADSSIFAKQHSGESIPERLEDGGVAAVEGTIVARADEQGAAGGIKDVIAESVELNGLDAQWLSNVRSGEESATNSSAQPHTETFDKSDAQEVNDEVKQQGEPDNSPRSDSLGNGKLNGANSATDESNKSDKQLHKDELPSTAGSTLMVILEKLISLDPTEVFKDPVDDSFAPNYSGVIKTPMCFSRMQEKIGLQQYASWRLFVDDFERICYNAMKYNQKRSRIWNAASTLLRQGKKVLEPYFQQGDSVDVAKTGVDGATKNLIENAAVKVVENAPLNVVENVNVAEDAAKNVLEDVAKTVVKGAAKNVNLDAAKNVTQVVSAVAAGGLSESEYAASRPGGLFVSESEAKPDTEIAELIVAPVVSSELELRDSQGREKPDPALPTHALKDTKQMVTVSPDVRDPLVNQDQENLQNTEGYVDGVGVNNVNEGIKVEILETTGSEDVRPDSRDEATECSSSFGYTQSKVDSDPEVDGFQQNAEVESDLRDGNGALSSAFAEDDELAGGNERGKKALNAEWKKYRRGIEWRCRWLEVRLNELRARAQKYDRLLEERKAKKAWLADVQPGEESSARSAQMVDSPQRGRILRRLRRKQVENTVDLDVYMARHPLFSRYGTDGESKYKKKKGEMEDTYVEARSDTIQHVQNQQNLVELERRIPEESDTEEQLVLGLSSVGGQDSMEQILWKVEALQARVEKAKSQLSKGAPSKSIAQPWPIPKPFRLSSQASPRVSALGTAPRPPGTKGRPPSGQSPSFFGTPTANGASQRQGSAPFRRKSSDYDINNMVMPVSVGAKYVEHIKHADIWTPSWRLIDNAEAVDQSTGGSSSDEDTDDEQFEIRHSEMEVNEKKQRYMLPPKRSPDGDLTGSGKGRSKSGMGKGAGKMAGRGSVPTKASAPLAIESPDSGSSPAFSVTIPKGKRRKRLFNATAFTTNHAQRLAAYLARPASSLQSPNAAGENMLVEDIVETRTAEVTSTDLVIFPEQENLGAQPLLQSADQADMKRKRSAASGLQVLANP